MTNTKRRRAWDEGRAYRKGTKHVPRSAMPAEKLRQVHGLRSSNAATAVPARKARKQTTRSGRTRAAIRDQMRG